MIIYYAGRIDSMRVGTLIFCRVCNIRQSHTRQNKSFSYKMNETEKEGVDKILDLYRNITFLDVYGTSVLCFVLLIVLFLLLLAYMYSMSQSNQIKNDWVAKRCEPYVIPFAGLINKPTNQTVTEFTAANFNYCINSILVNITGFYVQPFQFLTMIITSLFTEMADSLNAVRGVIDMVRSSIAAITGDLYGRFLALGVELQQVILGLMDSMSKTQATMVIAFDSVVSTYYVMKTLMGAILQFLVMFLIVMIPVILFSFFLGPWVYVPMLTFYAVTALILGLLITFIGELMGISVTSAIPAVPTPSVCFDGDTLVEVLEKRKSRDVAEPVYVPTPLRDVQVGDVLKRDGLVTAKLTLDAQSQRDRMFDLDGICVSADHYVWNKAGASWVRAHEHPQSVLLREPYTQPLLYCLNTETKRIHLVEHVFADWDDIVTTHTVHRLRKTLGRKHPIPDNIHRLLDGGLVPSTLIKNANGQQKPLSALRPGDLLEGGVEVVGVVEVEGRDVFEYAYLLPGGVTVCGGPQLVYRQKENKDHWVSTRMTPHEVKRLTTHEDLLLHLVTNTGFFWLHGVEMGDYNSLVDYYTK